VLALWNGDIVQKNNENHDIDCSCFPLSPFPQLTISQILFIARITPPPSSTHPGLPFLSTFTKPVGRLPLIQSLDTRTTSTLWCGCSSLQFTASLVGVQKFAAVILTNPKLHQVREPLDKIDPNNQHIDLSEAILYVLALSFSLDSELPVPFHVCSLTGFKTQTTSRLFIPHSPFPRLTCSS
jgi:hypothetical protein